MFATVSFISSFNRAIFSSDVSILPIISPMAVASSRTKEIPRAIQPQIGIEAIRVLKLAARPLFATESVPSAPARPSVDTICARSAVVNVPLATARSSSANNNLRCCAFKPASETANWSDAAFSAIIAFFWRRIC